MNDKKIAIILTSIERPLSLHRCLESIVKVWDSSWCLMIGLQDDYDSESFKIMEQLIAENPDKSIHLYDLEYDCGISKARNELINKASLWNCSHILLTADSILFNDSMKDLGFIIQEMEKEGYSRCGFNLQGRIGWEATLKLIPGVTFELDFIDPKDKEKQLLVPCDIVRNFHLSTTESMVRVGYDNDLIMIEHEDEAYRYKEAGYKVCCTNFINGLYEKGTNTPEYDKIRATNFRIGMQRLKAKYSLKSWVSYKNIERIQL